MILLNNQDFICSLLMVYVAGNCINLAIPEMPGVSTTAFAENELKIDSVQILGNCISHQEKELWSTFKL